MTANHELYDSLGIDPAASQEEIQAAYRRKAKAAHPDAGGSPEAFDRLSKAVAILKDPEARRRYDETGDTSTKPTDIHSEAMQAIASVLQMYAENDIDWDCADLVGAMLKHLKGKIQDFKNAADGTRKKAARYKGMAARCKPKRGKPNHLKGMLEQQANVLMAQVASFDHNVKVAQLACKLVAGHTYEVDPAKPQAPQRMTINTPGMFFFNGGR
jgi:curved DNA-binding protein CbpA